MFNLRLDRTERKEFSSEYPEVKARMVARMKVLFATTFQTNATYTGGYDDCQSEARSGPSVLSRALLTPQVDPGSRYRYGKST